MRIFFNGEILINYVKVSLFVVSTFEIILDSTIEISPKTRQTQPQIRFQPPIKLQQTMFYEKKYK
jgi:hypothetical protein